MSRSGGASSANVRGGLDRAAERGVAWLERRHRRRAWREVARDALRRAWVGPLVLAALWGVAWVSGLGHRGYGWWQPALVVLLVPLAVFARALATRWAAPFGRAEGLTVLDERLDLADRLRSADEYLASPERGGLEGAFARAAVADAERHLERAAGGELAEEPAPSFGVGSVRGALACAALLAVLVWLLPALEGGGREVTERTDELARRADVPAALPAGDAAEDAVVPPARERPPRTGEVRTASLEAAQDAEEGAPTELPEEAKDVEGRSARGASGEASSSAGSSQARGVPSDQGQSSKGGARKPKQKPRTKEPSKATDQEPTKKKDGEESGSTAGLGSASGSNKNPASTSWSSKDQVTETEDEEIEDDEEVEDEDSESEARGGVRPTLRDRKPAASRDLQIGFGNRPNPNARSRGGPSQPKKSRGTASLILGVPIPDHVKGQPNPGKTKITQERIEPKADPLRPAEARPRDARRLPVGRVPESTLAPWMRELVRDFFLEVRARDRQSDARPSGE